MGSLYFFVKNGEESKRKKEKEPGMRNWAHDLFLVKNEEESKRKNEKDARNNLSGGD